MTWYWGTWEHRQSHHGQGQILQLRPGWLCLIAPAVFLQRDFLACHEGGCHFAVSGNQQLVWPVLRHLGGDFDRHQPYSAICEETLA